MKRKDASLPFVPVPSNLIKQNCFLRVVSQRNETSVSPLDTFDSLDEVVTDSGVELRDTTHDYPITPEYVASFADSADYRKDPLNAISNSFPRHNLGDVSSIQHILSLDSASQEKLYAQLKDKFSSKSVEALKNSEVKKDE